MNFVVMPPLLQLKGVLIGHVDLPLPPHGSSHSTLDGVLSDDEVLIARFIKALIPFNDRQVEICDICNSSCCLPAACAR